MVKIKSYFSKQDKDFYIEKGKNILEKELRKRKLSITETLSNENILPLFKILFVLVIVLNSLIFFVLCKINKKNKKKKLLEKLKNKDKY